MVFREKQNLKWKRLVEDKAWSGNGNFISLLINWPDPSVVWQVVLRFCGNFELMKFAKF